MSEEIWKDVKGFEGRYQVSNMGRVRSLDRTSVDKAGRIHHTKGMILKDSLNKGRGYRWSFDYKTKEQWKGILEKNKSSHKPVAQLDDYGHEIKKYNTTTEASIAMNVSVSAISACIRGKSKHAAGYKWKHLY